jgi:cell wall-associated NlpC family hydrolase
VIEVEGNRKLPQVFTSLGGSSIALKVQQSKQSIEPPVTNNDTNSPTNKNGNPQRETPTAPPRNRKQSTILLATTRAGTPAAGLADAQKAHARAVDRRDRCFASGHKGLQWRWEDVSYFSKATGTY